MKAIHKKLAGLLILQLVIASGLYWQQQQGTNFESQPLANIVVDTLDKVLISDGNASVELIKSDEGQWQLPELNNISANSTQLLDRIDMLNKIKLSWPVATTSSSHKRFEVSEDQFERRIQLFQSDNNVVDLFIGTSPGFRKVHVRKAGDAEVYSVELNAFDFNVEHSEWLDKKMLTLSTIDRVKTDGFELTKNDDQWSFAGTEQLVDQEKVDKLVTNLQALSITGVADNTLDLSDSAAMGVTISSRGNEWLYQAFSKDDKYYLKRNDIDLIFTITKLLYDQFAQANVSHLAKVTEETLEQELKDGA